MVNVQEMKKIKRAAKAVTYLDRELLDMGVSYEEIVDNICFDAGVAFDMDSEECEADENYLPRKSEEAYIILFTEKRGSYEDSICEYYCDCKGALISNMKYENCTDVKAHPTYKALVDFYDYIEPLDEVYCKQESKDNLKELIDFILSLDVEVMSIGYRVSYEYWRHLDQTYYFCSNTYYRVGDVKVHEEDEESSLGLYVAHAPVRDGRKFGYADCGFAIAYKKKEGTIVACLYKQTRVCFEDPYGYKDIHKEVTIDTSDIVGSAKSLAETINRLTIETYMEDTN